jgi:hypothetical protein
MVLTAVNNSVAIRVGFRPKRSPKFPNSKLPMGLPKNPTAKTNVGIRKDIPEKNNLLKTIAVAIPKITKSYQHTIPPSRQDKNTAFLVFIMIFLKLLFLQKLLSKTYIAVDFFP